MRRMNLLAAVLAVVVVAAACGDDAVSRGPDGSLTEAGEISVFDLREGDCFDDPEDAATQVETVWAMPCTEPHDNEIYLVFDLPDGAYPGVTAIDQASDERCFNAFESFVGVDYFESELEYFPVTPTPQSWGTGDRTVYCALYALDLSKLTGSMRGSGR
jgi:hypothetical protein